MKKSKIFILLLLVSGVIYAQNEIPIAIPDTAETISESTIPISVLLNDYDLEEDKIEIRSVRSPMHGEVDYNDSVVFYTADLYIGLDSMEYRIREVEDNSQVSEYAWIYITINENPDIPVANNDEVEVQQLVPTELSLLNNDSDPNGDELIIYDVERIVGNHTYGISEDSTQVIMTTKYPLQNIASFKYRIKEKNTNDQFYSEWATVDVTINPNQEIPIAINDEVNTTGGVSIEIPVLDNDIGPGGYELEIESYNNPNYGTVEQVGQKLIYTPDFSVTGGDSFGYKIRLAEKPYLYDHGSVIISIENNPNRPVAIDDQVNGIICGDSVLIDVMANDYDPNGDEIVLKEVWGGFMDFLVEGKIVDDKIMYKHSHFPINIKSDTLFYTVMEKYAPESYSEPAKIIVNMQYKENFPVARADSVSTIAGLPVSIDIIENDDLYGYDVTLVNLWIENDLGQFNTFSPPMVEFSPFMSGEGIREGRYLISDLVSFGAVSDLKVEVIGNNSYDSLDINNINAGIHSDGYLFSKYDEILGKVPANFESHFEYPKGTGHKTIFSNSLWIGGKDENDSLYLAAQRYKQVGYDYQFGPISDDYSGNDFFAKWSRLWKLNKQDITYHINNYNNPGYDPIPGIAIWPGNGDVSNGQADILAPFYDLDEDGKYEPLEGDYPLIRGDQSVFFIFNDDRIHTETSGGSLKVEIQGMAYGYYNPNDELLNNTVFVHYDIYNRSEKTYNDTYLGIWTDIDLGYARDDYVGSNVEYGSYFGYNGMSIDGSGETEAYGENPPAQSITVVAGPFMDADQQDNANGGCDFSINGLNFGDGVVDNERYGLTRFIFNTNSSGVQGDPQIAPEYYNNLNGLWKDNSHVIFGGNGHESSGGVGPACRFMFPDESDLCNWGTDGVMPNGGYNQDGKYWTEEAVGNLPDDRRGLGVTGPFTFNPGDIQELEVAFCVGQGDNGVTSSIEQLFTNLDQLFQRVKNGEIIVPNDQLDVDENQGQKRLLEIYPNPANNFIYVKVEDKVSQIIEYSIYNSMGSEVYKDSMDPDSFNKIDISRLKNGVYIIHLRLDGIVHQGKFVKM